MKTAKNKATAKKNGPAPVKKTVSGRSKASSSKNKKAGAKNKKADAESAAPDWVLRLYVAGQTPKSLAAFTNLKKLCESHLANRYVIEVIDLSKHPQLAQNDQIVALPTLVRKLPEPIKRVIGDLSNSERVMIGMDLKLLGL